MSEFTRAQTRVLMKRASESIRKSLEIRRKPEEVVRQIAATRSAHAPSEDDRFSVKRKTQIGLRPSSRVG